MKDCRPSGEAAALAKGLWITAPRCPSWPTPPRPCTWSAPLSAFARPTLLSVPARRPRSYMGAIHSRTSAAIATWWSSTPGGSRLRLTSAGSPCRKRFSRIAPRLPQAGSRRAASVTASSPSSRSKGSGQDPHGRAGSKKGHRPRVLLPGGACRSCGGLRKSRRFRHLIPKFECR